MSESEPPYSEIVQNIRVCNNDTQFFVTFCNKKLIKLPSCVTLPKFIAP